MLFSPTLFGHRILCCIAMLLCPVAVGSAGTEPHFVPFDSSRLMDAPDPLPLRTERAYPNLQFQRPVELTHAGDGTNRVFVVEQRGIVHVFPNRANVQSTRVFLDIHEVVSRDGNEEGLLGLAFHPKYKTNGKFYVYYSTRPRASVIAEFHVMKSDPNRADRNSERVVLTIKQPFGNHNGGSIRFGPDGYLYIGLGDGGAANDPFGNGQNLKTLLGSILRIDVDHRDPGKAYAIPEDNPFADRGNGVRGEIWACGIRNAWRLSFDRKTGQLWTGDVGQNRYEEVDRIVRGGNYGWNIREGFHPFAPSGVRATAKLIDPLIEYFRHEGVSVTGGLVYRGRRLSNYDGAYFFGDYVSGNVWILRVDSAGKVTENRKVARTGLNIAAFGEDEAGEMYLCAFDGHIHRLRARTGDLMEKAKRFPRKLSETGLYRDTANNQMAACAIPYDVNVPLWSDGAVKQRFFALPRAASVQFDRHQAWHFPVGTVLIKTFSLPIVGPGSRAVAAKNASPTTLKRLETRLLVHAPNGWHGYTYVWNDAQTDAILLRGAKTVTYRVPGNDGVATPLPWYFPSRSDCMACHTQSDGFVLGPRTRQLNRPSSANARTNQIDLFRNMGIFTNKVPAAAQLDAYPDWHARDKAPVEQLARAYLDVNCAMCHARDGIVRTPDLRFDTPLDKTQTLGRRPGQGRIGPQQSKIITPGSPMLSELMHRVSRRGPRQMPPLATHRTDLEAVRILMRWINTLDARH